MKIAMLTTAPYWHLLLEQVRNRLTGETGLTLLLLWLTVALAGIVTYLHEIPDARSVRGFVKHVFPRAILHHPSARADLLFWMSRRAFMPLLVLPLVFSTVAAGNMMYWLLTQLVGVPERPPGHATPLVLCLFTITMLIAYDLSYYIYHYAQHKVPMLWELHKVHHSAQIMVGITKDRVHPLDELMNHWWDGLIPGLCYGIWLFFALDPVELTIFGLNIYVLRNILLMMDFVRHTHLKFSYGPFLGSVLLSPHCHQLHHSVAERHWNKNFGLTLIVWDQLFHTAAKPEADETFEFGLSANEADEYQSLYRLHVLPLKKMAARASRAVKHHRAERVFQSKA